MDARSRKPSLVKQTGGTKVIETARQVFTENKKDTEAQNSQRKAQANQALLAQLRLIDASYTQKANLESTASLKLRLTKIANDLAEGKVSLTSLSAFDDILLDPKLREQLYANNQKLLAEFNNYYYEYIEYITRNFTRISRQTFIDIPREDFFNLRVDDRSGEYFARAAMYVNDLTNYIVFYITAQESTEKAVLALEHVLTLFDKAVELKDVPTISAITGALEGSAMTRFLKPLGERLSQHAQQALRRKHAFYGVRNYKQALRDLVMVEDDVTPYVPNVGLSKGELEGLATAVELSEDKLRNNKDKSKEPELQADVLATRAKSKKIVDQLCESQTKNREFVRKDEKTRDHAAYIKYATLIECKAMTVKATLAMEPINKKLSRIEQLEKEYDTLRASGQDQEKLQNVTRQLEAEIDAIAKTLGDGRKAALVKLKETNLKEALSVAIAEYRKNLELPQRQLLTAQARIKSIEQLDTGNAEPFNKSVRAYAISAAEAIKQTHTITLPIILDDLIKIIDKVISEPQKTSTFLKEKETVAFLEEFTKLISTLKTEGYKLTPAIQETAEKLLAQFKTLTRYRDIPTLKRRVESVLTDLTKKTEQRRKGKSKKGSNTEAHIKQREERILKLQTDLGNDLTEQFKSMQRAVDEIKELSKNPLELHTPEKILKALDDISSSITSPDIAEIKLQLTLAKQVLQILDERELVDGDLVREFCAELIKLKLAHIRLYDMNHVISKKIENLQVLIQQKNNDQSLSTDAKTLNELSDKIAAIENELAQINININAVINDKTLNLEAKESALKLLEKEKTDKTTKLNDYTLLKSALTEILTLLNQLEENKQELKKTFSSERLTVAVNTFDRMLDAQPQTKTCLAQLRYEAHISGLWEYVKSEPDQDKDKKAQIKAALTALVDIASLKEKQKYIRNNYLDNLLNGLLWVIEAILKPDTLQSAQLVKRASTDQQSPKFGRNSESGKSSPKAGSVTMTTSDGNPSPKIEKNVSGERLSPKSTGGDNQSPKNRFLRNPLDLIRRYRADSVSGTPASESANTSNASSANSSVSNSGSNTPKSDRSGTTTPNLSPSTRRNQSQNIGTAASPRSESRNEVALKAARSRSGLGNSTVKIFKTVPLNDGSDAAATRSRAASTSSQTTLPPLKPAAPEVPALNLGILRAKSGSLNAEELRQKLLAEKLRREKRNSLPVAGTELPLEDKDKDKGKQRSSPKH